MSEGMSPANHLAMLILIVIYAAVGLVLLAAFLIGVWSIAVYVVAGYLPAPVQQGLAFFGL